MREALGPQYTSWAGKFMFVHDPNPKQPISINGFFCKPYQAATTTAAGAFGLP